MRSGGEVSFAEELVFVRGGDMGGRLEVGRGREGGGGMGERGGAVVSGRAGVGSIGVRIVGGGRGVASSSEELGAGVGVFLRFLSAEIALWERGGWKEVKEGIPTASALSLFNFSNKVLYS